MLKFTPANTKLRKLYSVATKRNQFGKHLRRFLKKGKKIYSLDLLAGHTCPGADKCHSKVVNGRIVDGKNCEFRCYMASCECIYPRAFAKHQHNTTLLRGCKSEREMVQLIEESIPKNAGIIRLHSGGDFFNRRYARAIYTVALRNPHILFYCYTKSLHFFTQIPMDDPSNGVVLHNFILTASMGGKYDHYATKLGLRTVNVVLYDTEYENLPLDSDDSHAACPGGSYKLAIHGVQPMGTEASKVVYRRTKGLPIKV